MSEEPDNPAGAIFLGFCGLFAIAAVYGFVMATANWIARDPYDAFRLAATLWAVGYLIYRLLVWRHYEETRGASRQLYEFVLARLVQLGLPQDEKAFTRVLTEALHCVIDAVVKQEVRDVAA